MPTPLFASSPKIFCDHPEWPDAQRRRPHKSPPHPRPRTLPTIRPTVGVDNRRYPRLPSRHFSREEHPARNSCIPADGWACLQSGLFSFLQRPGCRQTMRRLGPGQKAFHDCRVRPLLAASYSTLNLRGLRARRHASAAQR